VDLTRRRPLHLMRVPALVAVLLLALLPTVGRMAQAHVPSGTVVALCTAQGLKAVHLAADAFTGDATLPGHDMTHGPGADCAYCPLLAGLVVGFAVVLGLFAQAALLRPRAGLPPPRLPWHHPSGLGSRGPPAQACILA